MSDFHQDLDNMTRDMNDKSLEVEYIKKTPVLNMILERKDPKFKGGEFYTKQLDVDTTEELAQDYSVNDRLTHGTKDTTKSAKFGRKAFQIPVQLDMDEELENAYQTEDRSQLHNLAKHKVKKAQEAGRLHLRKLVYGAASDTAKQVQGLNSALIVDSTYGYNSRDNSAGTNDWWQPSNNVYTTSTQGTERSISINWLQQVVLPLRNLETNPNNQVVVVGDTLWLALQAEAQAYQMPVKYDPNGMFKYGIEEMTIQGIRIVHDPFLVTANNTAMSMTTGSAGDLARRVYILHLPDWDLYAAPGRYFQLTKSFDQKLIAGGADFRLQRLLFAGNLVCWHPNRQVYFSNVVA